MNEDLAKWLHWKFGRNQSKNWDELSDRLKQGWRDLAENAPLRDSEGPLPWEYAPGHRWIDRNGDEQWFVQAGTIASDSVEWYMDEGGGDVIRRRVGPWEVVEPERDND